MVATDDTPLATLPYTNDFITPADASTDSSSHDEQQLINNVILEPTIAEVDNNVSFVLHENHQILVDRLLAIFQTKFTKMQISAILNLAKQNIQLAEECLITGPTLQKILELWHTNCQHFHSNMVEIDQSTECADLISFYRKTNIDFSCHSTMFRLKNQPAIDCGGVRRHIYTSVLKKLSQNNKCYLFQGPTNHLRPFYNAHTAETEIFKVLGMIVGHSIIQEGIGFPYLSPLCYWYIAAGRKVAMKHYTDDDTGEDCSYFVTRVSNR